MTKVVSIALLAYLRLRAPLLVEHPLLQEYLDDGWELRDTLPVASNGHGYLMTFVLTTEKEALIKKETAKLRAMQGVNARSRTGRAGGLR